MLYRWPVSMWRRRVWRRRWTLQFRLRQGWLWLQFIQIWKHNLLWCWQDDRYDTEGNSCHSVYHRRRHRYRSSEWDPPFLRSRRNCLLKLSYRCCWRWSGQLPCDQAKTAFSDRNAFGDLGGMAGMGDAMDSGMVLSLRYFSSQARSMDIHANTTCFLACGLIMLPICYGWIALIPLIATHLSLVSQEVNAKETLVIIFWLNRFSSLNSHQVIQPTLRLTLRTPLSHSRTSNSER